jgi:pseudaminic acid cytidylyltransferase
MKLAVIPARGGSKRIPRKNIKPFAGRPMIAYAIDAARDSGVFDRIIVSTDDAEIADVARQHGAEIPFLRAPELADDHAGTVPVIADAIRRCGELGWDATQVCCIYPGVPLLQSEDLRAALALLETTNADYAFTVSAFPAAVQRALRRAADGTMAPFFPQYVETRTQDLEPGYYDAGQFYWGRAAAWLAGQSPHRNGRGLVIPEWRAVDIDTPDDWQRAELAFRMLAGHGQETSTP